MPRNNTPRSKLHRQLDQLIKHLEDYQNVLIMFNLDYLEGTESNMDKAMQMEILVALLEETKNAILLFKRDL